MLRLARLLSLVFNPLVYATLYLVALSVEHGGWAGDALLLWCLLVLGPVLLLLVGIRRGVWSDLDVSDLRERRTYMPWALLFGVASAVVAFAGHFPFVLRISMLSIVAWLAVSVVIGMFWKISLHVGGAAGILCLTWAVFGTGAALGIVWVPVAVAWARLKLRQHDLGQVLAGAAAGMAAVLMTFYFSRALPLPGT